MTSMLPRPGSVIICYGPIIWTLPALLRYGVRLVLSVMYTFAQCCGSESESGSESERIRPFLAETESESKIFVPDSDPDSDPDPVI